MTQTQPVALRLAEWIDSYFDPADMNEFGYGQISAELRRLHSRVLELEAEVLEQCRINGIGSERELRLMARVRELETQLVKEASRTAEEKLRADQMSQQHDTQAALNREARAQLAANRERKPLTDEQIDALWGGENVSVPQLINRRAISRAVERAHGVTQEKQG